ncbi:MAG: hypothetical protein IPI04_05335 [Ignavibacteria bacterium]|nr:hypothetical protein [Ignavibacteria bacterium]
MKEQNYKNHRRLVAGYHGLTFFISVALLVLSIYSLYASLRDHYDLRYSIMFFLTAILFNLMFYYARSFALKAQDRAIRAEENLRHFVLTGKVLDKDLKTSQILALRFAPDEEFPDLTAIALKDNLNNDAIKQSVKNWKADNYRV